MTILKERNKLILNQHQILQMIGIYCEKRGLVKNGEKVNINSDLVQNNGKVEMIVIISDIIEE